jgi:hypothetical protein
LAADLLQTLLNKAKRPKSAKAAYISELQQWFPSYSICWRHFNCHGRMCPTVILSQGSFANICSVHRSKG